MPAQGADADISYMHQLTEKTKLFNRQKCGIPFVYSNWWTTATGFMKLCGRSRQPSWQVYHRRFVVRSIT